MLKVIQNSEYDRMYRELVEENVPIRSGVFERIKWFKTNPDDTRLKNHALKKRMIGKFAFSITGDTRIVYEWLGKNKVRFLAIGGHNKVYSKYG